jgi:hypothetical protein
MRHIGYVTNQDHIKYLKAEQKIEDYHYILNFIFSNIKKIQESNEGIPYKLRIKNNTYDIIFRTPILTFIGDNEGLDKLCARYSNRVSCKKQCRNCGCTTENCDNPEVKIK